MAYSPLWLLIIVMACLQPVVGNAQTLTNGGFEKGDYSGWSNLAFWCPLYGVKGEPDYDTFIAARDGCEWSGDDNKVINIQADSHDHQGPPTDPISPVEGRFLAFLSTAASELPEALTGSAITQTFTLPDDAREICMSLRLLNNDTAARKTQYARNDFGGVALIANGHLIDQYFIDTVPTSRADAHVSYYAQAGHFYNSTSWLRPVFDTSNLRGQLITLIAFVINIGDNFVETRLLVDDLDTQCDRSR